jgi:hypothetical protein
MEVWSFAPPPEELEDDVVTRFGSRSGRSATLVALPAPYQDPMYGEVPSYDGLSRLERAHAVALANHHEETAKLQDEVMADVYSQADAVEDNGEGFAGPSDVEAVNT